MPTSVLIANCTFSASRASGIIIQSNNVIIRNTTIASVSSAGIDVGGYYHSFSESPFSSNLLLEHNFIQDVGRGHRTIVPGQTWGRNAAAIRMAGDAQFPNATSLHSNIVVRNNTLHVAATSVRGQPQHALDVMATTKLQILENFYFYPRVNDGGVLCKGVDGGEQPVRLSHCTDVVQRGNVCCEGDGTNCTAC